MACKIQEARLTPKSWVVGPKSNQDSDGEEIDGARTTHLKRSSTYYDISDSHGLAKAVACSPYHGSQRLGSIREYSSMETLLTDCLYASAYMDMTLF